MRLMTLCFFYVSGFSENYCSDDEKTGDTKVRKSNKVC